MINVLRTKASIFRNVKDYKFVPKLDGDARKQIVEKVSSAMPKFKAISLDELEQTTKTKLYGLQGNKYPTVLISKNGDVGIKFFDGEHLTITASNFGFDKQVVELVYDVANKLSNKLSFAYNDEYGYLMSSLVNIGSGLKLECDIVLSGLASFGKIEQVRLNLQKLGYLLKSTNEEHVYTISTMCNLGFNKEEIISEFDKMIAKVQELEVESLKSMDSYNTDVSYDNYMRAVGTLNSAYLMSIEELNTLTKRIIQGYNLGYVEVKKEVIEKLIQFCLNNYYLYTSRLDKDTKEQIKISKQVKKILKGE